MRMHRQRWKSFCESTWTSAWLFPARAGVLQGPLESELTNQQPWYLCYWGVIWMRRLTPCLILSVPLDLVSCGQPMPGFTPCSRCVLLSFVQGLHSSPHLLQTAVVSWGFPLWPNTIIEQFFHLSLLGITEDFVNHLNSVNNCLISAS